MTTHAWNTRAFPARYPGTCSQCGSAITPRQQIQRDTGLRQRGTYCHVDCVVVHVEPKSVSLGAHVRWHVNRNIVKDDCPLCV